MKKLLFLLPALLLAYTVPSDEAYFVQPFPFGTLIYPESFKADAQAAAGKLEAVREHYNQSFRYTPLVRPYLTLTGPRNQIANAWATAVPYPQITFYGAGAQEIDYFGHTDWIDTLLAHEGAHIYQLDAKGELPRTMERFLGRNVLPIFPGIPVPLFTLPNLWTPDFLLEGNAVYNESRLTGAGRLYGGRHRALFMALHQAGKLNATRLLNNHRDFPYLEEKYIVGGFFQAWLADRYGSDRVNAFFRQQGEHVINPLLLSRTFQAQFGENFYTLLNQFLFDFKADAMAFRSQKGDLISRGQLYAPLGGNDKALLVYESDGKTYGHLIAVDRQSGKTTRIKGHFLPGRPFCGEFGCATAASGHTATARIETGLFGGDRRAIDGFNGRIVQDFAGDRVLSFHTAKSFAKPMLYDGDRPLGAVVSNARYGPEGAVYTVRHEAGKRVFYRDTTPLFSIKAQGFLADVLPGGSVLFTAPTRLGNGLYIWHQNKIRRLGHADNVLDARWIEGDRFLISAVTAEGYETRIGKLGLFDERPGRPSYGFEKEPQPSLSAAPPKPLEGRRYNAPTMLRFSSLYPYFYLTETAVEGGLEAAFVDPLAFNTLNIGYTHGSEKAVANGGYHNRRYRLFYGASGWKELNTTVAEWDRSWGADVYAGYLLYQSNTASSDLTLRRQYDPDDRYNEPVFASLSFRHSVGYARAYKPEYGFEVAAHGRYNDRQGFEERAWAGQMGVSTRLIGPSWLELSAKYAEAETGWIITEEGPNFPSDPINFELGNLPVRYGSIKALGGKAVLSAAIESPLYFARFPLGLHRLAPRVSYERLELGESRYLIEETAAAIEAELLFAHRFDFAIEAGIIRNDEAESDKAYFLLKAAF
ncbi:MAG: hypothetical protein AB7E49_06015 [Campylobacterales bacterium]